jgi:hypothetical protein
VRRRGQRRLEADSPNLNLVPLLDMVSLLIQLMLINARFGIFAEVGSYGPRPGTAADAEPALGLVVHITGEGYAVAWGSGAARTEASVPCGSGGCAAGDYDAAGLRAVVAPLAARVPDENTALVVPDDGVPFDVLVHTTDVLRDVDDGRAMFPDVVFPRPDATP